jgi:hypothetical protein
MCGLLNVSSCCLATAVQGRMWLALHQPTITSLARAGVLLPSWPWPSPVFVLCAPALRPANGPSHARTAHVARNRSSQGRARSIGTGFSSEFRPRGRHFPVPSHQPTRLLDSHCSTTDDSSGGRHVQTYCTCRGGGELQPPGSRNRRW